MTNRRKVRRSTSWMRASGKHCVGLSVAMLLNVVLSALPVRGQATETVLYSFTGGTDGAYPDAGVIRDAKGDLYGTTTSGGLNQPACYLGCGVVYKIGTDGTETVLHAFAGYPTDGDRPFATVALDSAGNLYGTTSEGGPNAYGIVFKLDATGTETLLYSFAGQSPNGTDPSGGLILDTAGNIYGSTGAGGAFNYGTVFQLSATGSETVLYSFAGSANGDGWGPNGTLVRDAAGNLYGTTSLGGTGCDSGCGTVFEVSASGTETLLHVFMDNGADGFSPSGGLSRDPSGNLYGTTEGGGAFGYGTVFKLDATGQETILYSFAGGTDGASPFAGLVRDAAGNLYGSTYYGGAYNFGTVFKVNTSGSKTILHDFAGGSDGAYPYAGLILDAAGNLYGTTVGGGAYGYGTVFVLDPLGNGVDVSESAGDVSDSAWQSMVGAGVQFVVVKAWGGLSEGLWASQQLVGDGSKTTGAQNNGLSTGAYALLNYYSNGGTGADQVDKAIFAVGAGISKLKFMVVDVEECCGEVFSPNLGANVIGRVARIQRISDAVSEIRNNGLKAVIYTNRSSWQAITGNCNANPNGTNNCASLIALPLWDVELVKHASDCGDSIVGLVPFTPYPKSFGWQQRRGNQYRYEDTASGCGEILVFGIPVDEDFFDPTLFQ
jgi:uncharacterized repeat protein (TIGR03803 family)